MKATTPSQMIDDDRLHDLIAEYLRRVDRGEAVDQTAFVAEHSEFAAPLLAYFKNELAIDAMAEAPTDETNGSAVTNAVANATLMDTARQEHATALDPKIPEAIGRYFIVRALGQGAMGAVYLAEDQQLGRRVALKIPKFKEADSTGMLERFYREARAAALLRHPNICPVFDVGEIDGQHYISMAYIEGQTLSELIQAEPSPPEAEVADIVRKLALALAEAHAHGVVHRDLKPANVMIDSKKEPVVMDFGLAHCATQQDLKATKEGAIIGTIAYMSPEQASGDLAQLGPGTDIYSLGVILYEMLTGRVPFTGDFMSVLKQIAVDEPKPPSLLRPHVDPRLEAICLKMLAKFSAERCSSMQEVAQLLDQYLKLINQSRLGKSSVQRWPFSRPIASRWLVATAMVVAAVVLTAAFTHFSLVNVKLAVKKDGSESPVVVRSGPSIEGKGNSRTNSAGGWRGGPTGAPAPAIAPFDANQAKEHQAAWAEYLGTTTTTTNSIGMRMVLIPPGEFQMGSSDEEVAQAIQETNGYEFANIRIRTERPRHIVFLSNPYAMAATEVTVGQFQKFVEATKYVTLAERLGSGSTFSTVEETDPKKQNGRTWRSPGYDVTETSPVAEVTWDDCVAFCNWLSEHDNFELCYREHAKEGWQLVPLATGYRLPTEAEWEHACRAGSITRFSFGDDPALLEQHAWLLTNSGGGAQAVAAKLPNAFGLHDMHGNLYEWCQDWWDERWYEKSPANDPQGPSEGIFRVFRSSHHQSNAYGSRSTYRQRANPSQRNWVLGFRPVRTLMPAGRSQSDTRSTPDRAAAEWALEIKGTVSIRTSAGTRSVKSSAELPMGPFAVTEIHLGSDNQRISGLEGLTGLKLLKELHITGSYSSVRDNMLIVLPQLPSLQRLGLTNAPITDAGMTSLSRCPNLEQLEIFGTRISDVGFRDVRSLSKLKTIHLPAKITNDGLDPLIECRDLEVVHFIYSPVTAAGLRKLAGLPKLQTLWLWNCSRAADAEMEVLQQFSALKELNLAGTSVGDAGMQWLATHPRLSNLAVDRTKLTDAGLESLAINLNLTRLSLHTTQVSDAGMKHLSRMKNLRELNLDLTPISDVGLAELVSLKSLQEIRLVDTKVTAEGIAVLKKALPDCKVIFNAAMPAKAQ